MRVAQLMWKVRVYLKAGKMENVLGTVRAGLGCRCLDAAERPHPRIRTGKS